MFRIRKRTPRPVRYVRVDIPADGDRCRAYRWESDRTFRVGDTITNVPAWERIIVVDDPVTRGGVVHVPVAEPGWAGRAGFEALADRRSASVPH